MNPTLESNQSSAEANKLLTELPSPVAIYQESNKIIQSAPPLTFDQVTQRLGLSFLKKSFDNIKMIDPNLDSRSNLAKMRIARAVLLNQGHTLRALGDRSTIPVLSQIILSDYTQFNEMKVVAKEALNEYSDESALAEDLSYIRNHAGEVLERRTKAGQVEKTQAVSLATAFENSELPLTDMEKTYLIAAFTKGVPITNIPGSNLTLAQIESVLFSIDLYNTLFRDIVRQSLPQTRAYNNIPLSLFAKISRSSVNDYKRCQTLDGLKYYISEIIGSEKIPAEVQSLSQLLEIVQNHPEIKAVSFDLYDTLVQWSSGMGERQERMNELAANTLRTKYGVSIKPEQFAAISRRAWNKRWGQYQEKGNEVEIAETLNWMVDDILKEAGITQKDNLLKNRAAVITDLEKKWYQVELETAAAMPGARETLEELKRRGLKLCLTSNASWTEAHIKRVLNRFGLLEYFDAISFSSETGTMKHPERVEFFHHSWSKVGLKPSQVIHIGDSRRDDYDGAKFAGGNPIRYANPTLFPAGERDRLFKEDRNGYTVKSLEYFRRAQDTEAVSVVNEKMDTYKVPLAERERVFAMSLEIYQKTRDVVGPAYILLAEKMLKKLNSKESDLVLALGRDSIPIAMALKLLLKLEPERFPNATPEQVKYFTVSRKFLTQMETDPALRERMNRQLQQVGADRARNVLITDLLCGSGATHRGMQKLLSGKNVEGYYIDNHAPPKNAPNAHGIIKEVTGDPNAFLNTENMLLIFEALYSGPFESAIDIQPNSHDVSPVSNRKHMPNEVLVRGMSEQSILMLNEIALKGVYDAVAKKHRSRLLKIADEPEALTMRRLQKFIQTSPSTTWIDIWRTIPWDNLLASRNPNERAYLEKLRLKFT